MPYSDVHDMTVDLDLRGRLAASAAVERSAGATLDESDPETWAFTHRYELCSAPGWDDAWASAIAVGIPEPGRDPGVITDPMILSQVQVVIGA